MIEHKETIVACEESGHVSLSYNVILTTQKSNIIIKPIILVVTTKSALTSINYGKIGHSIETCHNRKIKVLVPTIIVNFTEPIA